MRQHAEFLAQILMKPPQWKELRSRVRQPDMVTVTLVEGCAGAATGSYAMSLSFLNSMQHACSASTLSMCDVMPMINYIWRRI